MATNGVKTFSIKINGIDTSIDAVKSLEKELFNLEQRITALSKQTVNVKSGSGGGSSRTSNTYALSEEEKLAKQIEAIDKKRIAYSKQIYQNYLAAKDILKETERDQKSIAAQERLQANSYSNTMAGLKQELADLKELSQTTDLSSESFRKMSDRILEITNRLKELEQAQGTFSRDVGHYDKAVQGFGKIKVAVGDVVREYDNYRRAMKELKQERFELAQTVGRESKEYKDVDIAVKRLESDYNDLNKSSAFMDNLLDTMQDFTAVLGIGAGLTQLFGIDDKSFQESMTRIGALLLVIKSLETLKKDWQSDEGWLFKPFKKLSAGLDSLESKIIKWNPFKMFMVEWSQSTGAFTEALDKEFTKEFHRIGKDAAKAWLEEIGAIKPDHFDVFESVEEADKELENMYVTTKMLNVEAERTKSTFRTFGLVVKGVFKTVFAVFSAGFALILPELIEGITNLVKGLNTAKFASEQAEQAMNAFNRQLEVRKDLLAGDYLRKAINDEQFLAQTYDMESEALSRQIDLLRTRAASMQNTGVWGLYKATQNTEFTGNKLVKPATVGTGKLDWGGLFGNDLEITIKDTNELEKAWSKCAAAIKKGKDYLDMWGDRSSWWETLKTEWGSLFASVKDTQEAMRGLGNIRLGDFISDFQEVNQKFNEGGMTAEEYAKKISELKNEMSDNKVLNSVIANLDKHIPDEGVRTAVQNIINELIRLDNAFNMTSAEQVHHWNQVRIDGMKEGSAKIKAQIDENERYEIEQTAHTEEQVKMVREKYARQRENQLKSYYKSQSSLSKEHQKKLNDAEDELMKLRIENMANGYAKQLALLKKEENDRLKKAKENGVKVGEIQAEIRKLYHRKQLELDRQWAYDTAKIYEDLYSTIINIQKNAMSTEVQTATQNTNRNKENKTNDIGYFYANYDYTVRNAKSMYDEILQVEIAASKKQAAIRDEQLFKENEFTKREENLRHKRMADEEAVALVMEELSKHQGEISEEEWQKINDNLKDALFKMNGEIVSAFNEGTIDIKKFFKLIEAEQNAHTANMNAIQKKYESDTQQSEADAAREQREAVNKKYTNIINVISRKESEISRIRQKAIVRDTEGWGVVNIKKTNESYRKVIDGYKKTIDELTQLKTELKRKLDAKEITYEDYMGQVNNIDDKIRSLNDSLKEAHTAAKNTVGEFISSIQQYVQALGQGLQQIMSALWAAEDVAFDKEQEALDKENERLQNALDKNEEILERHSNNVNDIEDELSSARGDRRQHLIDQLNAETAAEREAAQEKKRLEKEQEALERKQDALDKKRKEAQYKRDLANILISGALAAVNAYATKPFVPVGLAMGSLAIALTAAQYAIAKSAKPYAHGGQLDGGVADGPRHSQGGIKVLGGRAEIEGGEFITNRTSTAKNIDLLEYVNSQKRKVDINDLIDFYSSGRPKKTVQQVRGRFAEGGNLPTLRTDISINDRLVSAFEDYAKTPSVVQVVDIIDRTKKVNTVKVLAGLSE